MHSVHQRGASSRCDVYGRRLSPPGRAPTQRSRSRSPLPTFAVVFRRLQIFVSRLLPRYQGKPRQMHADSTRVHASAGPQDSQGIYPQSQIRILLSRFSDLAPSSFQFPTEKGQRESVSAAVARRDHVPVVVGHQSRRHCGRRCRALLGQNRLCQLATSDGSLRRRGL